MHCCVMTMSDVRPRVQRLADGPEVASVRRVEQSLVGGVAAGKRAPRSVGRLAPGMERGRNSVL